MWLMKRKTKMKSKDLKKNQKDKDQTWEVEQLELVRMEAKPMKMVNKKLN
jgi:hypothetical protein